MKKIIPIIVIAIGFAACSGGTNKEGKKDTTALSPMQDTDSSSTMTAKVMYTCTMHPEVISDKPGKCPKCGMDLVKKEMTPTQMKGMNMDSTKH